MPGLDTQALIDAIIGRLPAVGAYRREEQPALALEDWLSRIYMPPALKAILRKALPSLLQRSELELSRLMDQGFDVADIPTLPFTSMLSRLDPYMTLRGLLGEQGTPFAGGLNSLSRGFRRRALGSASRGQAQTFGSPTNLRMLDPGTGQWF